MTRRKAGSDSKLIAAKLAQEWLSKQPGVLSKYSGSWICLSVNNVIGHGDTLDNAMADAAPAEPALIYKVPPRALICPIRHLK